MITKELLNYYYEYKDGNLFFKNLSKGNTSAKIGDKAGHTTKQKYVLIKVEGKGYLLHRVIYCMHYGYFPKQVDHIDGNPENNKIENLRAVTGSQNCMNKKISIRNTSGFKNVHWHESMNKWRVQIKTNGITKTFGCYEDIELADLVAHEVRDKYFGRYARHN